MNPPELIPSLRASGFSCDLGPDERSWWVLVPADHASIRFALAVQEHRVEWIFRFGHINDLDRETAIDLLFLNHETTHFRVTLNARDDLFLRGTWPPAELDGELAVWLAEEFARTCERIAEDVLDIVDGSAAGGRWT